jgi:type II secretory pathway component PulK
MKRAEPQPRRFRGDAGIVLIVVMWVVLVVAGLVLVFARAVRVEALASANQVASLQAAAVARGGLQFLLAHVNGLQGEVPSADVSCEAVQVGGGLFWVLGPSLDDDTAYSFRIVDEASKINLNTASTDVLMKLPGMTAELAAAIKDWRDPDDEVSPGGAESEYYLLLPDPYYCKNGPFETVEEVLLVTGATPELLYGEDTNRNGVLDPNENDGDASEPADNADGHLDRGLLDYVTVYTAEPNLDASGQPRVNINDNNTGPVADLLRGVVSQDRFFQMMDRVRSQRPFRNALDFYFRVGLTMAEFQPVADRLTTSREAVLRGLVNVNTAPREVLLCLPALEESDVDALLAKRSSQGTDLSSIAWVVDVLSSEKAIAVGDYITVRSYQFSGEIVGIGGDGRAFKHYRAVVDAGSSPPRLLYWKDLTHLGWPLAPDIVSTLRSGVGVEQVVLNAG